MTSFVSKQEAFGKRQEIVLDSTEARSCGAEMIPAAVFSKKAKAKKPPLKPNIFLLKDLIYSDGLFNYDIWKIIAMCL